MKVRFGPFLLDSSARQLTREGRDIRLSPKAFDLLVLLLEKRPAVVDKATLREHLWPATHVVEASLSNLVAEIRGVSDGALAGLVRTVHGVGYAFGGDVEDLTEPVANPASRQMPCWVVWRDRRMALAPGENFVGRDRACAVWLDESGVSRRHAVIRVPAGWPDAAGGVTVEDLNSTNGTFLGRRAVTDATPLEDGDKLRIGSEVLVFRSRAATDAPTKRVRRVRGTGDR